MIQLQQRSHRRAVNHYVNTHTHSKKRTEIRRVYDNNSVDIVVHQSAHTEECKLSIRAKEGEKKNPKSFEVFEDIIYSSVLEHGFAHASVFCYYNSI